ncbi:MAG: tRNA epoxyqueuosine(34) reductase QueG [Burkholderiales bacterium]|jgi:epoxyqueuosine reductase|nr:tRNA epoxyqueuosine(34) reductase QueG [Burkholderiales bacterium]
MTAGDREIDKARLADDVKAWGRELGFQAVGIADADLGDAPARLADWLARGFHGEMDYMARQAALRAEPASLHPGTLRVVSARMDYLPEAADSDAVLADGEKAFVSRYALGRDYHKVLRARLAKLAKCIESAIGPFGYRVFTDSAPVMEVEFAKKSGIGWRGKHTLALARDAGSFFFLGEIYTDLDLPVDAPVTEHCGSCTKCLDVCPTQAIVAPYVVDARRCISYLTIELKGAIPVELRPLLGNRVYGCDDCQLVCPWNKYARVTKEPDFRVRNGLDAASLVDLFAWSREDFEARMAGSAIHRIGYERWLRNLAVGLGNAPASERVVAALKSRENDPSALVREHVTWALERQNRKGAKGAKGRKEGTE